MIIFASSIIKPPVCCCVHKILNFKGDYSYYFNGIIKAIQHFFLFWVLEMGVMRVINQLKQLIKHHLHDHRVVISITIQISSFNTHSSPRPLSFPNVFRCEKNFTVFFAKCLNLFISTLQRAKNDKILDEYNLKNHKILVTKFLFGCPGVAQLLV